MNKGLELEKKIARQLKAAKILFEKQVSVGGLKPDFIVHGPEGQLVVVEAKAWPSGGGNTARALDQVELYRKATGADQVYLVLDELKQNYENKGVVNTEGLITALRRYFRRPSRPKKRRKYRRDRAEQIIFAGMPFSREYDDTFLVAMSHAAKAVNAACKRVDRTEFEGDIVEEIKRLIRQSIAVIIDLSESKPNVLYEAGYAHALGKPSVHICSTSLEELPFDVRNWNTLTYNKGQTARLSGALSRRLKAVLR